MFFRFCRLFVETFDEFQLLGKTWGFLSNVGIFRYGCRLLLYLNLIDWRTDFSILQGLLYYFNIFLRFYWLFVKNFEVFQLLIQIWRFLSYVGVFRYGRGLVVYLNLVDWNTRFAVLQGFLQCFNIFFRFC